MRLIRNSSRFAPAFSFSASHFGVNPRPDQVAPDRGSRYFGATLRVGGEQARDENAGSSMSRSNTSLIVSGGGELDSEMMCQNFDAERLFRFNARYVMAQLLELAGDYVPVHRRRL